MSALTSESGGSVTVTVNGDLCKGCGICLEFCPVDVFELDGDDHVPTPAGAADCIECGKCELLCPDFALEVSSRVD